MARDRLLDLPFFDERHRRLADQLERVVRTEIEPLAEAADTGDPNEAGLEFQRRLASAGLTALLVGSPASGEDGPRSGETRPPDLRSLCLAREALAASSAVADAVFAVDGLGSYPIHLAGSADLRRSYLPRVASGAAIAAFALTEPAAGSNVAGIETTARRDNDHYVLSGTKTLISNARIADYAVVFAKDAAGPTGGRRPRLSAFVVDRDSPGYRVVRDLPMMAPHPIGEIALERCRVPRSHRLGAEGEGTRIALATLDFFRASVGAAACGIASRALEESLAHVTRRQLFGSALADLQATRFAIADMQADLDAARLLVYRAAWLADCGTGRVTREASTAKLAASEAAQRIVDRAVQLHGGQGVVRGVVVERLYREVRALRIYEGASEIQRLVIAERVLKERGD